MLPRTNLRRTAWSPTPDRSRSPFSVVHVVHGCAVGSLISGQGVPIRVLDLYPHVPLSRRILAVELAVELLAAVPLEVQPLLGHGGHVHRQGSPPELQRRGQDPTLAGGVEGDEPVLAQRAEPDPAVVVPRRCVVQIGEAGVVDPDLTVLHERTAGGVDHAAVEGVVAVVPVRRQLHEAPAAHRALPLEPVPAGDQLGVHELGVGVVDPEQAQVLAGVGKGRETVKLGVGRIIRIRIQDLLGIPPLDEIVAHQTGDLPDRSADGLVVEQEPTAVRVLGHRKRVAGRPTRHHRILRVVGPLLPVGREGHRDPATIHVMGLPIGQFVAPLRIRVRRVFQEGVGPTGPLEEDVVFLGSPELHQPQIRFLPGEAVAGGGVAEVVFDVGPFLGADGVVPHLEELLFLIPDHGPGLEHQVALPGPIRLHHRVFPVLGRAIQGAPYPVRLRHQTIVHEEVGSRSHLEGRRSLLSGFGSTGKRAEKAGEQKDRCESPQIFHDSSPLELMVFDTDAGSDRFPCELK